MLSKREIREEGHKRKFLAIVDGTPECGRAVLYAGRRASNSGGGLVLLSVVPPGDFQHWIGVERIMQAEAHEEASVLLDKYAGYAREKANIDPELNIREGDPREQVLEEIEMNRDIGILVLAAGDSSDGPGPLVLGGIGVIASFPVPVVVVPSVMSDEEIEAVT